MPSSGSAALSSVSIRAWWIGCSVETRRGPCSARQASRAASRSRRRAWRSAAAGGRARAVETDEAEGGVPGEADGEPRVAAELLGVDIELDHLRGGGQQAPAAGG